MAKLTKKQLDEKVVVTCYRETKTMTRRAAIKLYEEGCAVATVLNATAIPLSTSSLWTDLPRLQTRLTTTNK